ncbi:7856_t:CDS:10 [Paraglomus brasilianum]|uniref:7856_t:CDS:1 n=1 Tax=Paraglomus brasilianum TaxID=144538 RepID=A0A9N9FFE9_9GLOM|nr:7856_t:CDS:10 [Paraglomus brasilianum]
MPNVTKSSKPYVTIHGSNRPNFLSSWLFLWVFRILLIPKQKLNDENFVLQDSEKAVNVGNKLETQWNEERERARENNSKPSILKTLIKTFGAYYALLGLYKVFWIIFMYIGTWYLVDQLLLHIEQGRVSLLSGHIYALGFFLCALFSSICINQLIAECTRVGVQVRAALMVMIYRKSLRLGSVPGGISDVVNLLSNDCNRIAEAFVNFHFLWGSVLEMFVVIALSWVELGLAALPATVIIIVIFPLQSVFGRLISSITNSITNITSSRIHLMSEILTAIKLIKFYAWESYFSEKVISVREKELSQLLHVLVVKVWTYCIIFDAPVLMMLGAICVKAFHGHDEIKSSVIFTSLSLFNTLRYPLIMLPIAIRTTLGAFDSFDRLDKFFQEQELESNTLDENGIIDDDPTLRIAIENADFVYGDNVKPTLRFLNMRVKQGQLLAIVGDVGAGKSSILAAIMGQIHRSAGTRRINGSIAYVPHDSWLLNTTLRDNILFGKPYNAKKYEEALYVCALNKDLQLLREGDLTEIGDRGANLSLGQRLRVSLARAVYCNADIVLLDDPLSVMEASVGKHIFSECIEKILKDKAVVFVTNQLQYLSKCHYIMVIKDGTSVKEGTYEELIKDVDLASLIGEYVEIEDPDQVDELLSNVQLETGYAEETSEELETVVIVDAENPPTERNLSYAPTSPTDEPRVSKTIDREGQTLQGLSINERTLSTAIERHNTVILSGAGKARIMGGQVNRELNATAMAVERNQLTIHSVTGRDGIAPMYDSGLKSRRGQDGHVGFKVYLDYMRYSTGLGMSIAVILLFFLIHALRIFGDWWLYKFVDGTDVMLAVAIYATSVVVFGIGVFIRGVWFAVLVGNKSMDLHDSTFGRILLAPMSFFDITPLARILNVFAKHQYLVDDVLTDNLFQFLSFLPLVLGVTIFVMVLIPWMSIVAVILAFFVWVLIYCSSEVEERFKQLEVNSKAPIFAHLSASLDGLASIRVYNVQSRFDEQNMNRIDANNKALFAMMQVKAWLSLYIDVLTSLFIYATALFIVIYPDEEFSTPSISGLAITNAFQLLVFTQWMIRSGRDVAVTMDSTKQLLYYRQNIPAERPAIIDSNRPPPNWGERGEIEFKHVILSYNQYGVAVLKNISFHIRPQEKIGIVGKTGSGKSTLLVSLLRIVELTEGQILIDDADISVVGLKDLRSKIAIIPQEPVIFVGTIRSNLDPFNTCTDEEIWEALKAVHLDDKVNTMSDKLRTTVLENGKNFSLGQRQLFCIARALLKKTNILILDEATSAVDAQTDVLIQETIKKNFADHTVLTIAHRLNTIMEADRILCLNEGRVVEFDTPLRLLDKPDGFFHQLATRSGPEVTERLRKIALNHLSDNHSSSSRADSMPLLPIGLNDLFHQMQ